jgi:hypothetical protein
LGLSVDRIWRLILETQGILGYTGYKKRRDFIAKIIVSSRFKRSKELHFRHNSAQHM